MGAEKDVVVVAGFLCSLRVCFGVMAVTVADGWEGESGGWGGGAKERRSNPFARITMR